MGRYKGVPSKATIRREFPHDVVVPWAAVGGKQIPLVDIFFAQAGQPKHFSRLRKDNAEFYIYRFADPQHAQSFAAMFDGEIVPPRPPIYGLLFSGHKKALSNGEPEKAFLSRPVLGIVQNVN